MNKFLVLIILFLTLNNTFAEYSLNSNEKLAVQNASELLNQNIEEKWERYRNIIIKWINSTLENSDDISEQKYAILENLRDSITIKEAEEIMESEENEIKDNIDNSNTIYLNNTSTYNETEIKKYWIDLLNNVRKNSGLKNYKYDESLNKTAKKWSDFSLQKWYMDHKVNSWDSYYNYYKKVNWMSQNWVVCKNVNRITFTESIAWWTFKCLGTDCTEQVKQTIKWNFNFFMSEKGKAYAPHYKAIINKNFETLGLWISIKNLWNNNYKLYLTNHYCTTNIK